jgi:mono/diheme cytochrome c family protein
MNSFRLWIALFLSAFVVVYLAVSRISGAARSTTLASRTDPAQLPLTYIPPGKQLYRDYCAACHGSDGKGQGPAAASLVKRPADLTTLAKRHGGEFPEAYITTVLRFGLGLPAHGSSEMPVWGPIFQYLDNYNEAAVRQRIKNLCEFLESIQER